MSCPDAHHAGAYVLGALSPAERQPFERHLAGCAECAGSVRELAGLPGLLARVDPETLQSPAVPDPVPDTLLPALVRQVRRTGRRRRLMAVGVAAAAAAAVAVATVALTGVREGGTAAPTPPARSAGSLAAGRPMVPVGTAPVRATVAFDRAPWGTRLDLTCTYSPRTGEYGARPPARYALFVRTRAGPTEQVATWRSLRGGPMRLTAATAASRHDITAVLVRTAAGEPVLRLAT